MTEFVVLLKKLWRFGYGALGSLYYQGADGVEVEEPIGNEGEVLTVVGGLPAWSVSVGRELLVEDGAAELLFDDTTGDVLYEG